MAPVVQRDWLGEIFERIRDRAVDQFQALGDRLQKAGGWRGLFDPHAAEWTGGLLEVTPEQRQLLIDLSRASATSVQQIVRRYQLHFIVRERNDIVSAAVDALAMYAVAPGLPEDVVRRTQVTP